jgi:hypothetical protein
MPTASHVYRKAVFNKHINSPGWRKTLIEFFKNLISFPLNLRSHGKSCDLAVNLINKVNKIVALRGAIGLLRGLGSWVK